MVSRRTIVCGRGATSAGTVTRAGDQLVVTKLDRLGRSRGHLSEPARILQQRQIDLVVLDQGVDSSTAVGRMLFQILGAISEFEHALMSKRTLDGLEAARSRGRIGGQIRSPSSDRVKPSPHSRCTTNATPRASASTPSPR